MRWMHVIIFTQINHLIQDKAGRRTCLTFFKNDRFLDLIVNFELPLHANILCKSLRVYEWSEMTEHSFFVLIQK